MLKREAGCEAMMSDIVTVHSSSLPGNALPLLFSDAGGSRHKICFMDDILSVMSLLPGY